MRLFPSQEVLVEIPKAEVSETETSGGIVRQGVPRGRGMMQ